MGLLQIAKRRVKKMPALRRALKRFLLIDYIQARNWDLERKLVYSYLAGLEKRVQLLEAKLSINLSEASYRNLSPETPEPTLLKVTSQAATYNQLMEPVFAQICGEMGMEIRYHRKIWEYVFILQALKQAGVLAPSRKGVGFGVGKDPMVAVMAKAGCDILATDLDIESASEKGWASTNQFAKSLDELNENGLVSNSYLAKKVSLRTVDMNNIPTDLQEAAFDFTWSACAFEHLGSLEQGKRFVLESLKCLRPGGVAVHTTEFNISSDDHTVDSGGTVLYRKRDFEDLAQRVREAGGELQMNFNTGDQPLDRYYDLPPYSDFNHLKLRIDNYIVTSFGLVIRKLPV